MSKKSIVAVDDSNIVLLTIEKILSEEYEVKSFSKEMRALKYLKVNVPDLIILDIEMPEMNGFEMLAHIKEKEELKEVPVVFLTSNSSKEHVVEAVKGGAVDYMVKPINENVLLEKVHKILGETKSEFSWDDI
jgi:PleD family two-component response regulator